MQPRHGVIACPAVLTVSLEKREPRVTIENFLLDGPAGRSECLLKLPVPDQGPPRSAAVVCHPHPLFGGTMHNKIVHAAAGALVRAGIPALRFNFRGVGLSGGKHDGLSGLKVNVSVVLLVRP